MDSRGEAYGDGTAWSQAPRISGPRNLPRASHACQSCRMKKARCDQRQPCTYCVKHFLTCIYTAKRKRAPAKQKGTLSPARHENSDAQGLQRTPMSTSQSVVNATELGNLSNSTISCSSRTDTPETQRRSISKGNIREEVTSQDHDMVGDINSHTSGTEFYGTSSNFVLLNQLFSHAQLRLSRKDGGPIISNETPNPSPLGATLNHPQHLPSGSGPSPQSGQCSSVAGSSPKLQLGPGRPSIINVLYNEEALLPPSRPKTPATAANGANDLSSPKSNTISHSSPTKNDPGERGYNPARLSHKARQGSIADSFLSRTQAPPVDGDHLVTGSAETTFQKAERRLEREYVRIYLHNLHYIHPVLDAAQFMIRCEEEIWTASPSTKPNRDRRHFLALYNIVVAVGALIAGTDVSQQFERELLVCARHLKGPRESSRIISSPKLSKIYFWKARSLLGDVFEVCSVESAQTHLLMVG